MSYASLAGLPDTPDCGRPDGTGALDAWYFVRSELDMDDEPMAILPDELRQLGDSETRIEFDDSVARVDTEVLVVEWQHGLYVQREAVMAQPFPCDDSCAGCRVGRIALRAGFSEDASAGFL